MRYAIIRDGIVENLTEWDGNPETWQPPEGATAEPFSEGAVSIGWPWNDGAPADPNPPAPLPPPVPAQTAAQKLATIGLSLHELKAALAAANGSGK